MKYGNLHLHSQYSDCNFTPEQLFYIGKSLGYYALALTDHENDKGVRVLMDVAKREGGVDVISGNEFYGMHEGVNLHLTALDYDMDNPAIRAFIDERVALECEHTRKCVEYGQKIGVIEGFGWDEVVKYNPDGAWLCIDSVYKVYRTLKIDIPENLRVDVFRSDYAKSIKQVAPTAEQVIKLVRGAGGVIALAHPYKQTHFIPKLVEFGLNGVEVSHPGNAENTSYLAEEMAKEYKLYRCGGTDHTGPMSCCGGKHAKPAFHGVTEEEYYVLKERKLG